MKNRKIKILLILIYTIMVFMISSTNVYGAKLQASITITPNKTEVQAGDKVTFSMKLENVTNAEGGIVGAIAGKIEYDKNFFEGLEYTEITMNEETGKFIRMNGFTNNSAIGTISLKVKSGANGSGKVYFKELSANDGRDDLEEGEATTQDVTITITVKNESGNTTGGNTAGGNATGGSTTGGNTTEGNTAGGNTAGGNTTGGSTTGGNTTGGSTTGGNTTGENTTGGNTTGGNTAGGNTTGGSTTVGNTTGGNTTGGNMTSEAKKQTSKKQISAEEDTKAKSKKLPKAGMKNTVIILIPILAIISIVAYKKYNKYKSI